MQSEILEVKKSKIITYKIKSLSKTKRFYKLEIENHETIIVNEDDIFEFKLYKDQEISSTDYEILKEKGIYYQVLEYAVDITSKRFITSKMLQDKLENKQYDKDIIIQVVQYLKKIKLLDDKAFQESYIAQKVREGYGPLYIKNKLYEKGINTNIKLTEQQQKEILEKKYVSGFYKSKNKREYNQKFINKMKTQGFDMSIIKQTLYQIDEEEDLENLDKDARQLYKKYANKYTGYKLKSNIYAKLYQKGYDKNSILQKIEELIENEIH
ncbi:RecX family transcriptional regulator [Mycoplasma sp. P36-A1]|uniref:RecX family transcriptional regulator n=1 Tax=Mycoplasma sp. P36-A1 TaxID=3252900 RepID=UPI003C2F315C